jgi:hypothetical protein
MADHLGEINKIIQKAALDGVLTEGAVKQFHEVLEANKVLTERSESLDKRLKDEASKNVTLTGEKNALFAEMKVMSARLADVEARETKMTELELIAKHQGQRVDDHKNMVALIFRNTTLKKQVMTPIAAVEPNQYNSCPSGGFASKDDVTEEEV